MSADREERNRLAEDPHGYREEGADEERERIRQMALDRCEKLEEAGELLPAATLRDFAARLEDK